MPLDITRPRSSHREGQQCKTWPLWGLQDTLHSVSRLPSFPLYSCGTCSAVWVWLRGKLLSCLLKRPGALAISPWEPRFLNAQLSCDMLTRCHRKYLQGSVLPGTIYQLPPGGDPEQPTFYPLGGKKCSTLRTVSHQLSPNPSDSPAPLAVSAAAPPRVSFTSEPGSICIADF